MRAHKLGARSSLFDGDVFKLHLRNERWHVYNWRLLYVGVLTLRLNFHSLFDRLRSDSLHGIFTIIFYFLFFF